MTKICKPLLNRTYPKDYWETHRVCPHCGRAALAVDGGTRHCPLCGGAFGLKTGLKPDPERQEIGGQRNVIYQDKQEATEED